MSSKPPKVPTDREVVGSSERPDDCPICGTEVIAQGGALGVASSGEISGEPFSHQERCPTCGAVLRRMMGTQDPWSATAQ